MRGRQVDWRLLAAVMLGMFLIQVIVPAAKAATSYLSIDIGLGATQLGIISAGYALLPVFLTLQISSLTAMRDGKAAVVIGSALVVLAIAALAWAPHTLPLLVTFMAVLGVGQTLVMTALQSIAVRSSGRSNRDVVLGNTSMAIAIGHALGPALIWVGAQTSGQIGAAVLSLCAAASLFILAASLLVARRVARRRPARVAGRPGASREVWSIPGMPWILTVGALSATAIDLLVVFIPLLGAERGLSPGFVGLLLTLRALASIAVRFFYSHLVHAFGRSRLMSGAIALAVAGFAALAFPLPAAGLVVAMLACGFGLGVIGTNSMAMTLDGVAPALHTAAISLRLGTNRLLQFAMPLGAGVVAASLGVGSIFAIVATCLIGNALLLRSRQ